MVVGNYQPVRPRAPRIMPPTTPRLPKYLCADCGNQVTWPFALGDENDELSYRWQGECPGCGRPKFCYPWGYDYGWQIVCRPSCR